MVRSGERGERLRQELWPTDSLGSPVGYGPSDCGSWAKHAFCLKMKGFSAGRVLLIDRRGRNLREPGLERPNSCHKHPKPEKR